ncbi:hypothetical protein OUZ56_026993 [Daphnia magna]|uniref:Secreted protein n=1 Tax=Daphnia magna TaxID=35525 RepID=A0ABQ9ZPF5_9CRUS|nr:hypothetical protein OUZ56_026993 [Daphnia magna]
MCFKGFFVKKFTIAFVCGGVAPCQLRQLLNQVFIYFVLLTISPQHPRYPDFQVSLISQPSSIPFSSSLWLLFLLS